MGSDKPQRRRRDRWVQIRVTTEEGEALASRARGVGMSVGGYLRAVGLGYQPRASIDHGKIQEMLRINGDLGRLGGLLKLWLTDDRKLAELDPGQVRRAVRSALQRIEETQAELRAVVRQALRDRSGW